MIYPGLLQDLLSVSWSILALAAREVGQAQRFSLEAASSVPEFCFTALEFSERQEAGKALKINSVEESETREVWQIDQGHTANHAQTRGGLWVSGAPDRCSLP